MSLRKRAADENCFNFFFVETCELIVKYIPAHHCIFDTYNMPVHCSIHRYNNPWDVLNVK